MQHHSYSIIIMSGPYQGQVYTLDGPLLIGRDPSSRIPVHDERASRHHAIIELNNDHRPILKDLGSKNGTFVNGHEIRGPYELATSDQIRVGNTLIALIRSEVSGSPPINQADSDTHAADISNETPSISEQITISRRSLRLTTKIMAELNAALGGPSPWEKIIEAIRQSIKADGAGFLIEDSTPPLKVSSGLCENFASAYEEFQKSAANQLTRSKVIELDDGFKGYYLVVPVRLRENRIIALILYRHQSRPFHHSDVEFGEALGESLITFPLDKLLLENQSVTFDDRLGIIGSSQEIEDIRSLIRKYATTNTTVLIRGESGTGKELCAQALVKLSDRRDQPYIEINCACMIPELIEAELFGYEKGAFSGAQDLRMGKLENASGGTIFLDEIGELPLDLQAKLLRLLEGSTFYRVGGTVPISVDVRFLCATNRDLQKMVSDGQFREDLYHRINILSISMPPLRNHIEDIPELVPYLIEDIRHQIPNSPEDIHLTPKAFRRLLSHTWPGNVRELKNTLQRMILLNNTGVLDNEQVPQGIGDKDQTGTTIKLPRLQVLTEMLEREEITRTLKECEGHKSNAAQRLGISRPTLDKKIKQYGLEDVLSDIMKNKLTKID